MPVGLSITLKSVSVWLLLATIFLLPVTALPWTLDPFEINKQLILVVGVLLSTACLLAAQLTGKNSLARPSVFTFVPLVFLGVTIVSAALSLSPATSWLGLGSQEYVSVLSLLAGLGLFALVRVHVDSPRRRYQLVAATLAAAALVGWLTIPSFFGINLRLLNNLVGLPHALGLYLLIMSLLGLGVTLFESRPPKSIVSLTVLTALSTLAILLAIDSVLLWCLTMAGVVTVFAIAFRHAEEFVSPMRFAPHVGMFVIAAIFVFLPTRFPSPFLQEVSPSLATTWGIVQGSWNDSSVAFGTGPGTFALDYAKYVSIDVNQTEFWDVTFDRGHDYFTTLLATQGLTGALAWLFFVIVLVTLSVRKIFVAEDGWQISAGIFTAWSVLMLSMFVYTPNLTLMIVFWWLSAMLASTVIQTNGAKFSSAQSRFGSLLMGVIVLIVGVVGVLIFNFRFGAELALAKATKLDQGSANDELIRLLDHAAATNHWDDVYSRNLAVALLNKLGSLSAVDMGSDEYVQSLIQASISAANQAAEIAPNNPLAWEVKGLVYRELMGAVPDGAQPALQAYARSVELSPVNPRYRVELARTHLALAAALAPLTAGPDKLAADQARAARDEAMLKAEAELQIAIALKPDYAASRYFMALLQEKQGKLAEAIKGLESVRVAAPGDVGVGLELAQLYLRQGKNDLAEAELQRILVIAPDYANAHWYLSVVFEQKGDLVNAIVEVEKVLAANPENTLAQTRLDRLKAGETSEIIPEPVVSASL